MRTIPKLLILSLCLLGARDLLAETPKAGRPNILFIYTDDQSHRTLGCYRAEGAWPWVRTPNIAGGVPYWLFLRQGKYKYVRSLVPDEIEEFCDLEADPQELKNLALDATRRSVLVDYRARLLAELQRTQAGFVNNLPPPRR